MTSTAINRIEIGDIITFGFGTSSISQHSVIAIDHRVNRESNYYIFTLDNGDQLYAQATSWAEVTKPDLASQRFADAAATAYANAWDRKR